MMRSATNASATREKASHSGGISSTATRMKTNEPPHNPARTRSRARSEVAMSLTAAGRRLGATGFDAQRQRTADAGVRSLMVEQPLLAPQSAAVAGERAVGADYAMTRNDEAQRVVAVRASYSAHGGRTPDGGSDFRVRARGAWRNREQRVPDRALERRSAHDERRLEAQRSAPQILPQLRFALI